MIKIIQGIIVILFMLIVFTAYADTDVDSPGVELTLSEAIQEAIASNPEIQAARHGRDVSKAQVKQARSVFFPRIDLKETFNRTTNPMWAFGSTLNQESITAGDFAPDKLNHPDPVNNYSSKVEASWTVFSGGKLYQTYQTSKIADQMNQLTFKQTKQSIIAKTARAYVNLMLAIKSLDTTRQALLSANANLKMVESRFDKGFSVKSDLLRAQVRITELEQHILKAENRIEVARAWLNGALGRQEIIKIDPVTPFDQCVEVKGTLENWTQTALANRTEFRSLKLKETVARKQINIARAEYLPSVHLVGSYEFNSEDPEFENDSYAVGAMVTMNLFNGFGSSAKSSAAASELQQIREYLKNLETGIKVQTREAYLNATSAWKRIQVAEKGIHQSEVALEIIKNRYQAGLLTIVSLIDAELANQTSKMLHFKALHDYKTAKIDLELAAGTLTAAFH